MATQIMSYKVFNSGKFTLTKKSTNPDVETADYNFNGIQYTVYQNNGSASNPVRGQQIGNPITLSSNKAGPIELPAGNYVLQETKTNNWYKKSNKLYPFTITRGVVNTVVEVSDEPNLGTLTFTKDVQPTEGSTVPANKDYLSRLEFNLTSASTNQTYTVKCGYTLNALTGEQTKLTTPDTVQITNLPYGEYSLTEDRDSLLAAQAAVQDTNGEFTEDSIRTLSVTVGDNTVLKDGSDTVTKYTNYWDTIPEYRIRVNKLAYGGSKLDGWKFELQDQDGNVVGKMTDKDGNPQNGTDETGTVYISGLPGKGVYTLRETNNSKTYTPAENPITVSVAKSAANTSNVNGVTTSTTTADFVNNKNFVNIKVKKSEILSDGSPGFNIYGIKFTLYDSNHNEVATGKTDAGGELVFNGEKHKIIEGTYVLEETDFDADKYAPGYCVPGYDKPSRQFTLEGNEGTYESSDPQAGTTFTNIEKPPLGTFTIGIQKTSSESGSTTLPDYSFEGIKYGVFQDPACEEPVKDENGKAVTITLTESGAGIASFKTEEELETLDVYVKEISTTDSYKLSSEVYDATAVTGEILNITASDDPEVGSLSFTKVITCDDDRATPPDASKLRFVLTNRENPAVSYTETVGSGGSVTFRNVLLGEYILTEEGLTDYTKGYMLDSTGAQNVTIEKGSNSLDTDGNKWTNTWVPAEQPGGIDIVKKTNNGYITDLSEFHITITDVGRDKVLVNNQALSRGGTYSLGDLYPGTYRIHENLTEEQLKLYSQPEDQTITIHEGATAHTAVTIQNNVKTTTIKVIKKASDGNIDGIEFRLHGTALDGQTIGGARVYTEEETISGEKVGVAVFENVKPGEYVVAENGYNSDKYTSNHRVDGYDVPAQKVTSDGVNESVITFINTPFEFHLTKTELLEDGTSTTTPIPNAGYTLYKIEGSETSEAELSMCQAYEFTTDENGKIDTYDLPRGTYLVYETAFPNGYIQDGSVPGDYFDESAEESSIGHYVGQITLDDNHPVATLVDTNQREYGAIFFTKEDDAGNPVAGAVFGLYTDPLCLNLAKNKDGKEMKVTTDDFGSITDEEGTPLLSGLTWGTYYLKEIQAPRGYKKDRNVYTCEIGADCLLYEATTEGEDAMINERSKGKVQMIKQDADTDEPLNGAHFDLYTSEGELIAENLITGEDNNGDGTPDGTGEIHYDGLSWGAYYFKETQAPENYVLTSELTRFTVNAFSANGSPQIIYAEKNQKAQASIVITIKMKADDYWKEHGDPTFYAVVTSKDGSIEYRRPYTFDSEFIEKNIDAAGYVSKSITFNIPAGEYNAYSIKADRYELYREYPDGAINSIQLGELGDNDDVDFDIGASQVGAATFVYAKTDWSDYSDQTSKTNIVKKSRTFTGISVAYLGDEDDVSANMPFTKDLLSVYALFDDGTQRELTDVEFSVTDPENGNAELTRFPTVTGYYTYNVSATINGTTRYGNFTVFVKPWKKVKTYWHTDGGSKIQGAEGSEEIGGEDTGYIEVWQYQTLGQAIPNSSAYKTTKYGFDHDGWFKDAGLETPIDMTQEISEDTHFYSKWVVAKYKITYFAQPSDPSLTANNVPEQQTKTHDVDITLSDKTPSVNKGYDFLGWSTSQGKKTAADVTHRPGDTYNGNEPLNLYAVWKPHTATLTYDTSDWEDVEAPDPVTMSYDAATYAHSEALPDLGDDLQFAGWSTEPGGEGTIYKPGDEVRAIYTEPEDMTLYAIFGDIMPPEISNIEIYSYSGLDFTVTDNSGVAGIYLGPSRNPSEDDFDMSDYGLSIDYRTGFDDAGTWYLIAVDTVGNRSEPIEFNIQELKINTYKDNVLMDTYDSSYDPDRWVLTGKVSLNGGSTVLDFDTQQHYIYWPVGTSYEITDIAIHPEKVDDIVYKGLRSGSASLTGTIGSSGTTVNLDCYSKGILSYSDNLGDFPELEASNIPDSQNLSYTAAAKASNKVPTRTGFTFLNWNTEADGSGTSYDPGDIVFAANSKKESTTLYAQWEQLHLGSEDLSWANVGEIANMGIANRFFNEDFTTVKDDLGDDGTITSANLNKYTKTTSLGGNDIHAFIAGFDHDETTDGGTAAITFMTYEYVGTGLMEEEGKTVESWSGSTMRNTTMADVYSSAPNELKAVMKAVKKKSIDANGAVETTNDAFFLPSVEEHYGVYAYDTKPE